MSCSITEQIVIQITWKIFNFMRKKYHRKKITKHIKIKVIQDALGEYWDVYEERTAQNKLHIYRGWQYGCTPADEGISPVFSYILTHELGEFIKAHPIKHVHKQTGLTLSVIGKMRVQLGVNRNFVYRNDEWLLANQNTLLNESYKSLKNLYKLTRPQVNQQREWLTELLDIKKRKRLRNTEHDDKSQEWFNKEYINFKDLSVQDLMEKYKISKYLAIKTYNKYQSMNNGLSYAETLKDEKRKHTKWILDNNNVLFSSSLKVTEIATNLNKSVSQITRLRKKLKNGLKPLDV